MAMGLLGTISSALRKRRNHDPGCSYGECQKTIRLIVSPRTDMVLKALSGARDITLQRQWGYISAIADGDVARLIEVTVGHISPAVDVYRRLYGPFCGGQYVSGRRNLRLHRGRGKVCWSRGRRPDDRGSLDPGCPGRGRGRRPQSVDPYPLGDGQAVSGPGC